MLSIPDLAPNAVSVGFPPHAASFGTGAVLFVEDQEMIARMLMKSFARAGLVVCWARNGTEALEIYATRREEISLAFVDCQLPDLSGGELCIRLREETPGLPVLLTSGREQLTMRSWLEGGGATDFVAKPYSPREIVIRMRTMLAAAA